MDPTVNPESTKPVTPPEPSVVPSEPVLDTASPTPTPTATAAQPIAVNEDTETPVDSAAAQPVAPNEAPAAGSVVVGGTVTGGAPSPSAATNPVVSTLPGKSSKKRFILAGALVVVILLAAGGGVYGLYLPTRPANVFGRGLDRTGTALQDIVTDASKPDLQAKFSNTTMTGKVDVTAGSFGALTAQLDGATSTTASKLDLTATYTSTGGQPENFGAKLLVKQPSGKQYPNTYFQLSGLSALGLDTLSPGITQYDGKWLELSSDYLQSLSDSVSGNSATTQADTPSAADVTALAKSLSDVAKEYILTNDTHRSILQQQAYLGKETLGGVQTSHFRVGLNKANFKAFCTPLTDTVFTSQVAKKTVSDTAKLSQAKAHFLKSCQDQSAQFKASDTFDIWIGGKYDMIRQARVYDEKNAKNYFDIGQKYTGGNTIPLYADFHNDADPKADVQANMTLNAKTGVVTATVNGTGSQADSAFKLTADFNVTPSKTPPVITEPTGAVDISQLLDQVRAAAQNSSSAAAQSSSSNDYGLNI